MAAAARTICRTSTFVWHFIGGTLLCAGTPFKIECKSSLDLSLMVKNPFGLLLGYIEANAKNATRLHLKSEIYTCQFQFLACTQPTPNKPNCNFILRKKTKNFNLSIYQMCNTNLHLTHLTTPPPAPPINDTTG